MEIKFDDQEFCKIFSQEIHPKEDFPYLAIYQSGLDLFEKNKEKLNKFITKDECLDILFKIILKHGRTKIRNLPKSQNKHLKLDELFDENERNKIKEEIENYLTSLPKKYTVVFYVDNVISAKKFDISFDDNIILKFDKKIPIYTYGLFSGLFSVLNNDIQGYNYSLSIHINEIGYITQSNFGVAHSKLKQILYLAISFDIFKINHTSPKPFQTLLGPAKDEENHYKMDDEIYKLTLAGNEIDFINRISIDNANHDEINDKLNRLKEVFSKLNKVSNENGKNKIKSGLEWAYEAKITTNETFRFILIFIAIEAVLGDDHNKNKDKTHLGIMGILKNRCAYLLGKSHEERKEIFKEFPNLYDLRSQLVHGSQAYLTPLNKEKLLRSEKILESILNTELNMLV